TLVGIFYFDIPVTILLAFVFHRFVKTNLINNLPHFLQRKFYDLKKFDFEAYFKKNWMIFIGSAIIGIASHLFWDSFTHPNTFIVRNLSIYNTIVPYEGARYPLYYALQVISSYLGLFIVLIYVLLKNPDNDAIVVQPIISYWLVLILITGIVFFLRFHWLPHTLNIVRGVITVVTGLCIALLIAGRIPFSSSIKEKY
ncbi:MAG TPA: DUF4184 family protein, partial [Cyclobacteriaceae bacterium]